MRLALTLLACVALAGCDAPTPDPAPDTLPEPEAAAGGLRGVINQPLDKAKSVDATQAADETERQKALEDAGG